MTEDKHPRVAADYSIQWWDRVIAPLLGVVGSVLLVIAYLAR